MTGTETEIEPPNSCTVQGGAQLAVTIMQRSDGARRHFLNAAETRSRILAAYPGQVASVRQAVQGWQGCLLKNAHPGHHTACAGHTRPCFLGPLWRYMHGSLYQQRGAQCTHSPV